MSGFSVSCSGPATTIPRLKSRSFIKAIYLGSDVLVPPSATPPITKGRKKHLVRSIDSADRIPIEIAVDIDSACQPDGIGLDIPPGREIVVLEKL